MKQSFSRIEINHSETEDTINVYSYCRAKMLTYNITKRTHLFEKLFVFLKITHSFFIFDNTFYPENYILFVIYIKQHDDEYQSSSNLK